MTGNAQPRAHRRSGTGADGHPARFQTTSWSLVLAVGDSDHERSRAALAALCEIYWPPIYAFVRRQGHGAEDARDLTQAFFTQLLERDGLRGLVRDGGRFRSFLLTALRNLLSDERRKQLTLKRGAGRAPLSIDHETAEASYHVEPSDALTPERAFEKRWAATVLERAMNRLQAELAREAKSWEFERLKPFLTGERPVHSYREVAAELEMSEQAVRKAVQRLRERFGRTLRGEIARIVEGPVEIDDELRHLLSVLKP